MFQLISHSKFCFCDQVDVHSKYAGKSKKREKYKACPSESGTDKFMQILFSLNAHMYYKMKSGT
jgi:hypothetical protein